MGHEIVEICSPAPSDELAVPVLAYYGNGLQALSGTEHVQVVPLEEGIPIMKAMHARKG